MLPDDVCPGDITGVFPNDPIRIIPTGPVTPPKKRDLGFEFARGDFIAFIDDDAYPDTTWLDAVIEDFKDPVVAAVGGPAVNPPHNSLSQKVSGAIYASPLGSAEYAYRYLEKPGRLIEDFPTCNLIVRKSIMGELGGFKTVFWPGEDTKLCFDIVNTLKKKIIYDPRILVYHNRRPVFLPHLRQVASYALHRGYFVKRFPATSRKFIYFIPSVFVIVVIVSIARPWFFPGLMVYAAIVFIFSLLSMGYLGLGRHKLAEKVIFPFLVFAGIILTHCWYGVNFIRGLCSRKLKEEK